MNSPTRRAAALIIVLLILLGLMLLGLPFLFSQRWGLAGARSVQMAQAQRIYLATAERLGSALGAYANAQAWKPTSTIAASLAAQQHAALDLTLNSMVAPATSSVGVVATASSLYDVNSLPINLAGFGYTDPRIRVGLTISDESGRLDPNLLDAQSWQDLFQRVGIIDWDDQAVNNPPYVDPLDSDDADSLPELCQTLEWRRVAVGPYQRLEDLRQVSAQEPGRRRGACPQFRKRLNAAELERLRPYLSFQNRGPGR
jgi:hypothetical protein